MIVGLEEICDSNLSGFRKMKEQFYLPKFPKTLKDKIKKSVPMKKNIIMMETYNDRTIPYEIMLERCKEEFELIYQDKRG